MPSEKAMVSLLTIFGKYLVWLKTFLGGASTKVPLKSRARIAKKKMSTNVILKDILDTNMV